MSWLLCKFLGHRWYSLAVNWRKHINLVHLHTMAGYKAECLRCGETWDDLWSPFFSDEVIEFRDPPSPLPSLRKALPAARMLKR